MTRDFNPWTQHESDIDTFDPVTVLPPDDDLNQEADTFARHVAAEAHQIRVRDAARDLVAAERAGIMPPYDAGLLTELLARPPEPQHRVEDIIPSDGAALVVAQRKTGKTTYELNLARSLVTGEAFLGTFPVRRITGRVGFLNFEVSSAQLARWAYEAGIPAERFYQVNLRGRRNPFGNPDDLLALAKQLHDHDVESLIVDPFGRAFNGKSQNDAGEVGAWLANLDRFARSDVGAIDLILSAHAGWDGERTRGASALEDWADVVITLVRDKDDDQIRFMRAEGRDILVDEDELTFDPETRHLALSGAGSRRVISKSRHMEEVLRDVLRVVADIPGVTGYGLAEPLRDMGSNFQKNEPAQAAKLGVERGLLRVERGARNANKFYLVSLTPIVQSDLIPPTPGVGQTGNVRHDLIPPHSDMVPPLYKEVGLDEVGQKPGRSCAVCSQPLHKLLIAAGETTHPLCKPEDQP